jgi:hypothetical protein
LAGAAEEATAACDRARSVQVRDRPDAADGPGCTAQAAAHGHADLPPACRGERRRGHLLPDGPTLRRRPEARDPGGVREGASRGVRPSVPPARHGSGSRLRRRQSVARRRTGHLLPVLLPAVLLRQGRPPRLRLLRPGSVLRRPRSRAPNAGRRPADQGPLRQPEVRSRPGPGPQPGQGGDGPLDRVPLAFRHRELLLPARHRRRPREGRGGGPDRLLPPQPLHPSSRSHLARRTEPNWSISGTSTTDADASGPGPGRSTSTSRSNSRCWRPCRTSRSKRAGCSRRGWTDTARSRSAPTATQSPSA